MKLLSFSRGHAASWGVAVSDGIVDLGALIGGDHPDLKAYLAAGMPRAEAYAERPADHGYDQITFAPVIPNPSKIPMVALNYQEDGENARPRPDHPVLFLRLAASQIGHGAALIRPRVSERLDFEGELAAIIGKGGRHIPREQAMAHVAGYACYNDGSVRDWQRHSHQFTAGKNFAGTGAFGPWMVTADELDLSQRSLALVSRVNGVEMQRTETSRMIFDVAYLIAYLSTFVPLEPGDVVVTGTCSGFGSTRTPPQFLGVGDVVEIEIEGIGTLSNTVEDEPR